VRKRTEAAANGRGESLGSVAPGQLRGGAVKGAAESNLRFVQGT